MWLVDTGYASFSAFDELKGQIPFHRPRPEELFNRKEKKTKERGRKKRKEEEAFKSLCRGTLHNQKPSINFDQKMIR